MERGTWVTNIQATCSHRDVCFPDHSIVAVLRRRCRKGRKATVRLIGCALGLLFFQSVVAWADAPNGSVYVPLDSWVYPAFDRLAGLGAINNQFVGLRPWTRIQCAQLVMDADENMQNEDGATGESMTLYDALRQEFSVEIDILNGSSARQAGVESLYTRALGISGTPLRDGYNFGQTLTNDFGRPYNTDRKSVV